MWFDVGCETFGQTVRLFGEDACKVAKYYGMYLKHLGVFAVMVKQIHHVKFQCIQNFLEQHRIYVD